VERLFGCWFICIPLVTRLTYRCASFLIPRATGSRLRNWIGMLLVFWEINGARDLLLLSMYVFCDDADFRIKLSLLFLLSRIIPASLLHPQNLFSDLFSGMILSRWHFGDDLAQHWDYSYCDGSHILHSWFSELLFL
jgi:hypothetical protein